MPKYNPTQEDWEDIYEEGQDQRELAPKNAKSTELSAKPEIEDWEVKHLLTSLLSKAQNFLNHKEEYIEETTREQLDHVQDRSNNTVYGPDSPNFSYDLMSEADRRLHKMGAELDVGRVVTAAHHTEDYLQGFLRDTSGPIDLIEMEMITLNEALESLPVDEEERRYEIETALQQCQKAKAYLLPNKNKTTRIW